MKVLITDKNGDLLDGADVPEGGTVVVEPVDPDNRTQAERNADNALAAARLQRVEARLQGMVSQLNVYAGAGVKKIDTASVLRAVLDTLEAPVA